MDAALQATFAILPELILVGAACGMLLLGPFLADDKPQGIHELSFRWMLLGLITIAIAAGVALVPLAETPIKGPFDVDSLSNFVRLITFSVGPVLMMVLWRQVDDSYAAEAHACLLMLLAGVNLVALSANLIVLFLALELVSIPTYVLLFLPRHDAKVQEAVVKYFLLSIFSSAITLYGMSWLFGVSGSTSFQEIAIYLAQANSPANHRFALLAVTLIIAGLSFRIAAVPFHFYAPDVFQGVTTSGAAILAIMPKVVGFAGLVRVVSLLPTSELPTSLQNLLAVAAIATMFIGNLVALRQTNLQRLLAYSSIAHSGYMLVGLAVVDSSALVGGEPALWFYLASYAVMTAGLFALLTGAGGDQPLVERRDLAGLSRARPAAALLIALCLFGLTGLPPTAGLTGKLNLLLAACSSTSPWGVWLASAIAVNSAIAAYYYLRLIMTMYYGEAPATQRQSYLGLELVGGACALASVAIFVAPTWLVRLTQGI